MMPSFKEILTKSLQTLPQGTVYNVYDIKKKHKAQEPLFMDRQDKPECTHRLILITAHSAVENDSVAKPVFCCGMEVYEYKEIKQDSPLVIYISKVDSTGEFRRGGISRRLVQAYLASQTGRCHIHVFARAQKQYLFARSAENSSKVFLSNRKLIAWWRTILSHASIWPHTAKEDTHGWWIIPGEDNEATALFDIGQKRAQHPSVPEEPAWCYGHPYGSQSIAKYVIPQFEDDPKSRYLKNLLKGNRKKDGSSPSAAEEVTTDAFWDMLGYSEECRDGQSAIFVLHLTLSESEAPIKKEDGFVDRDTFSEMWNDLMFRDFSSFENAQTSTTEFIRRWRAWLEFSQCQIHTTGPTQRADDSDHINHGNAPVVQIGTSNAVNVLSVRPKRTPEEPKINVLSGSLVKRKKALEKVEDNSGHSTSEVKL